MNQETFQTEFYPSTRKLARIKAVPYLHGSEARNLQYFVLNVLSRFASAAEAYGRDEEDRLPRFVVVEKAQSGDGKSYVAKIINESIQSWGSRPFRQRLLEREADVWHSHVSWDVDGLAAARAARELRGNPLDLAPPRGLLAANNRFQEAFVRSVRRSLFTTVEGPVGCVLKDPDKTEFCEEFEGRVMSTKGMINFFRLQGPFEGMDQEYNIEGYALGLCGSPELEVASDGRGLMKLVKNLNEAYVISDIFGRVAPGSIEELKQIKADGASSTQMRKIDNIVWNLMFYLVDKGQIKLPRKEEFAAQFELPLKERIGLDRPMSTWMRYSAGTLLEHIFKKDFRLDRRDEGRDNRKHYFIGFNNPTLEELGIDEDRQELLRQAYQEGQNLTVGRLLELYETFSILNHISKPAD